MSNKAHAGDEFWSHRAGWRGFSEEPEKVEAVARYQQAIKEAKAELDLYLALERATVERLVG